MPDITTEQPQRSCSRTALPAPIVDLISQGIPLKEFDRSGRVAPVLIWCAVRRTAASAQANGWTRMQWFNHVAADTNILFWQLKVGNPRRPKPRELKKVYRDLDKAWDASVRYRASEEQAAPATAAEVSRRSNAVTRLVQRHADRMQLSYTERQVLAFAAAETRRYGWLNVTLPARRVAQAIGRSAMAAHKVLRRLAEQGLLVQVARGRAGTTVNGGSGSAAIYQIPVDIATFTREDGAEQPHSGPVGSLHARIGTGHDPVAAAAGDAQVGRRAGADVPGDARDPGGHG
ncbi:putative transcriptional regulator, GntR family protein [Rhodococcus phage E3]|uniref:putative transcriptional regulator, GntR family protein n=1 Tax=Rhodococcus phage E3 TaxID=1007869 RepID=UPI0002C6D409|nr:putative transcriptional regulator, GntR family protein [Rhodococcus phage E3]AEQ21053.1 putative transcriptional regulator, GntR family protein [Rhodococcus phage E3]